MNALVRYRVAVALSSQRYLAPLLVFLVAVAILTGGDSGPLVPTYALTAGAVFACTTWLTVVLVNAEDPTQRAICQTASGGPRTVVIAAAVTSLLGSLVLGALALVLPPVSSGRSPSVDDLLLGTSAQLIAGVCGVTVGLVCSQLVIRRTGYSFALATALVLLLLLVRQVSPVGQALRLMADEGAGGLAVPLAILLVLSMVLLGMGASVATSVQARKS